MIKHKAISIIYKGGKGIPEGELTLNKEYITHRTYYITHEIEPCFYHITNDIGRKVYYIAKYFISVDKQREKTIDGVIDGKLHTKLKRFINKLSLWN